MPKTTPIALLPGRDVLNQTLVDAHLICIPGFTTLTAWCLPRSDFQTLGWETDGALHAEVLALGTLDEFLADLLETLNFARCQGDADLVDFLQKVRRAVLASCSLKARGRPPVKSGNVRVLHRSPSRVSGMTYCLS